MSPPRKVHNLRCRDSFREGARAILAVQLAELEERRANIAGPEDSGALHDLRIAAKRLRYSLETFAVAFPAGTAQAYANRVRDVQDVLGRIHDVDVLEGLLAGRIRRMDEEARARGLDIAQRTESQTSRRHELEQLVWGDERHARLGLYTLIGAKVEERRLQYSRFVALWNEWEESGLLGSIRTMVTDAPISTEGNAHTLDEALDAHVVNSQQ